MKKMMMIAGVGLMSTTLFVGCQNASPESKRIGSAAIGGGAGGAVGKHIGGNIGAGLGQRLVLVLPLMLKALAVKQYVIVPLVPVLVLS